MPRNYKRKDADRCILTDNQLNEAKLLISQGLSKRQAAIQVGIKESTLRKRLKLGSVATSMGRFVATFTTEQEIEILAYLKRCDELYYGVNMVSLRKLIYEYAEINKISHRFNSSSKMAGRDWVYGFLNRHPELKLRQPTPTSIARAMGFNKVQVQTFYNNLATLYEKFKFQPSRIFNMDESGVNTVPKKIPKVISIKGKKLVGKIVSAERGQTITLVCSMSATGNYIPPAFIFPRKRMQGHLLNHAPSGSIGMVSDSGFINTALFLDYLCHFKDNVQPTPDNPVLLILDNHSTHLSLAAVNYCRENHIHMLTLPPHSSHKMQPLDRGFFSPLKVKFAYECDKWLTQHPGRVIGQTEVAYLVNEAFLKAATLNNAVSGFKVSGIWPMDSHIFAEEDFMAASVTDINTERTSLPPANLTANSVLPGQITEVLSSTSISTATCVNSPSGNLITISAHPQRQTEQPTSNVQIEPIPIVNNVVTPAQPLLEVPATQSTSISAQSPERLTEQPTSNVQIEPIPIINNIVTPAQPSLDVPDTPSTSKSLIPLTSIQPFPKASIQNRRRKGKKSIIATDSPYKRELEQKKKEEEDKIAKKRPRLNLNKETTKTDKKNTIIDKNKAKNTKNKTKNVKTGKKNTKATISKASEKENEYYCPLCNEKYEEPPTEDWIQCSVCNKWWHEQCTSFDRGNFICDQCSN